MMKLMQLILENVMKSKVMKKKRNNLPVQDFKMYGQEKKITLRIVSKFLI